MKAIEPLQFDPGLINDYLQCFASDEKKLNVLDELEHLYGDLKNVRQRLNEMDVIGNPNVFFDFDDEEE